MIRQCAWCRRVYGEKEPVGDRSITHGICLECSAEQFREAREGSPVRCGLTIKSAGKIPVALPEKV